MLKKSIIIALVLFSIYSGFTPNVISKLIETDQLCLNQQGLVEIEIIQVPNKLNIEYLRDKNIGNGVVRGHFLVINGNSKAWISMLFFKYVPPGYVAFDLVCTNITITVKDSANITHYKCIFNGGDTLFSNNWLGSTMLNIPNYSDFSIIEIAIYGNYE